MSDALIPVTSAIADYLLISSAVAAILVTAAGVVIKLGKIEAPVTRHLIWICTLFVILISPAAWLYGPKLPVAVLPHQDPFRVISTEPAASPPAPAFLEEERPETQSTEMPPVEIHRHPARTVPVKSILVCLWALGFSFMMLRLLLGFYRVHGVIRSAAPFPGDGLPESMRSTRSRLLLSPHIDSPVCFGLFRPVVLLPETMQNEESPETLDMILNHELAHIERRDCWTNLFQRLMEAAFFFHPWIWYASSQLTQQREILCDHHVIAKGAAATDYARLLTRIVEQGLTEKHLHAVALFEGRLLSRIKSLMTPGSSARLNLSKRATSFGILFILLCPALGTIHLEARSEAALKNFEETLRPGGHRPDGDSSISGRVVSEETGRPVKDTTLLLSHVETNEYIKIRTADDGIFGFRNISDGMYFLQIRSPAGFLGAYYFPDQENENAIGFSIAPGENRSDIILELKTANRISGRVMNIQGRSPEGLEIKAFAPREADDIRGSMGSYKSVSTSDIAEDGSYFLDKMDGQPVYLMVYDPAPGETAETFTPFFYPGTPSMDEAVMISFGDEKSIESLDFQMAKGEETAVEGVVTDRNTSLPIANALVYFQHADMQFYYVAAYTDETGHYRIDGMTAGDFRACIDAKPWGYVKTQKEFYIDAAAGTTRMDFPLLPAATISGNFIDEEGRPIEISNVSGWSDTLEASREASNRTRSRASNILAPANKYAAKNHDGTVKRNTLYSNEGDIGRSGMTFPTPGTFTIPGIMPGDTQLGMHFSGGDQTITQILYGGKELQDNRIETKPGEVIETVAIVVGKKEPQVSSIQRKTIGVTVDGDGNLSYNVVMSNLPGAASPN